MGVPLKVALPIWVMKTIIRNMKPGTWNPKSKSPNFFSGKSIITSMNIKGQVFHPTKVAHKHKSFSLCLNRYCHINDKIPLFLWISEITFPLFCVLRMALRVALPIWVGSTPNLHYFLSEKKDNFQGIQRAFFQSRAKINFPFLPLFSNINSACCPVKFLILEIY